MRVTLWLNPTAEGGRSHSMASGYRSIVRFEGTDVDFGVELDLLTGPLAPGGTGGADMRIWAADELAALSPGRSFELREGARVVGRGVVE